jgi:hypothetical protein
MKTEQHRWAQIRDQAQTYLAGDFARQVVHRAQNQKKLERREYMLIGITAALCLLTVAIANWYIGNIIQQKNLARWGLAQAQIGALRTSI